MPSPARSWVWMSAERALQVRAMRRPEPLQVLVHAQDHLRLVLQLAHLVVDLLQRTGGGEQVLLVVGGIEHGQLRRPTAARSSQARRRRPARQQRFGAAVSSAAPLRFGWTQTGKATGAPAWAVRREDQAAARRRCGVRRPAPLPSAKVSCRAGDAADAAGTPSAGSIWVDDCGIGGGVAGRGQRSISSAAQASPLARRNRAAKPVGSPSARQRSMRRWSSGEEAPHKASATGPSPSSNSRLPRAVWA